MPFGTCRWRDDGSPILDPLDPEQPPKPVLRQEDWKTFTLRNSLYYEAPARDPDTGTCYVVSGADRPEVTLTATPTGVVVPPNNGGRTDLASVPWFMWWLVASYGNHTRATLLHDVLIADRGEPEPVPRTTADRLFLTALREPGQRKAGAFRHWVMWAAVSVFGTLRPWPLRLLFVAHAMAFWVALVAAFSWAWGPTIWSGEWTAGQLARAVALTALIVVFLLALFGLAWRAGVDVHGGWLAPTAPAVVLLVVGLWREWPEQLEWSPWASPFNLLACASVLYVAGFLWGYAVDPILRRWLWPTVLIGLPIAALPVALIFVSVGLVWIVDVGAAVAAAPRKENGRRRGFRRPDFTPQRAPF